MRKILFLILFLISSTAYAGTITIESASGGNAPTNATYITQSSNATLTNEQALDGLSDGILKHASGVVATANSGTDYIAVEADTLDDVADRGQTTKVIAVGGLGATTVTATTVSGTSVTGASVTYSEKLYYNGVRKDADWDSAYTHISSTGADHSYIDQDVTSGSSPTLDAANITGYTELDTLSSVTGRGASTETTLDLANVGVDEITATTVSSTTVKGGTIYAEASIGTDNKVTANTITGNTIITGTLYSDNTIGGSYVTGTTITGTTITGDTIHTYDLMLGSGYYEIPYNDTIQFTIEQPDQLDTSDTLAIWSNESGKTFNITEVKAWSDVTYNVVMGMLNEEGENQGKIFDFSVIDDTPQSGLITGSTVSVSWSTITDSTVLYFDAQAHAPNHIKVSIVGYYN